MLTAENDPTQIPRDLLTFSALLGSPSEVPALGRMGHKASLKDPQGFVPLLERSLG